MRPSVSQPSKDQKTNVTTKAEKPLPGMQSKLDSRAYAEAVISQGSPGTLGRFSEESTCHMSLRTEDQFPEPT